MPHTLTRASSAALVVLLGVFTTAEPQDVVSGLPPLLDPAATRAAVVGEEAASHLVQAGETFPKLAAWYGVDAKVLAAENGVPPTAKLQPGQSVKIPTRHVIPSGTHDGIVINIPQRHLFYFTGGNLVSHYPVAVGRGDWRTPTGGFHVATKEENPTWDVPKSIQEEMRRNGKAVTEKVPPGPDNPLGKFWLGLNRSGVGIHGTNNADSIYRSTTHGCIRMHAGDIEDLFSKVAVKTPVNVIYQPVLMAIADNGVFVEAHPDVYRKGGDSVGALRRIATEAGVADKIDWAVVTQVVGKREGVARPVMKTTTPAPSPGG
jgi:L,D-transpeptidase ErfK/SrfK